MNPFQRIYELKQEADALPPPSEDFWSDDPNGKYFSLFFQDILDAHEDPHVQRRLEESDLSGTAEEVYRRLNDPRHPVRNALILWGISKKVGDQ